ncbi:MAG: hypothetical protein ACRD0S_00670, partial [Acidimicrobiales bacterium]
VNSLASIGIVLSIYAVAAMAATLTLAPLRRARPLAPLVAFGVAAAVLGAGYIGRVADDRADWRAAARAQEQTLRVLRAELPSPEPRSVIWTFGQVDWQAPGVPVFAATWDLNGAVQLLYDDPTLSGYPAHPSTRFDCGAAGVALQPAGGGPAFPYGGVYFVDIPTGAVDLITDADDCRTATARFRPGPT